MKRLALILGVSLVLAACSGHSGSLPPGTGQVPAAAKTRFPVDYSAASYHTAQQKAGHRSAMAVGSFSQPVDPNPPVFRPPTPSCSVQFLNNVAWGGDALNHYAFTPPAACPGPWAKVVLDVDVSIASGSQYDRTMEIKVGQNLIFRGTTSEPSQFLPTTNWHVEKDITNYSALFAHPTTIGSILPNYGDPAYVVNAKVTFYEPSTQYPAPVVPDAVLPISQVGGYASVSVTQPGGSASAPLTFPQNTERVVLDVYAMGQSNDEFWSFNVPNDAANNAVISSGGTSFREIAVSVDGQPAGVAWPFHYIFTGGLDPDGWMPITAIDTHNIQAIPVELTPFVGTLTDGMPHTIAMTTPNNANYWMIAGDVLVYTDHANNGRTMGAVTSNTIESVAPQNVIETTNQLGLVVDTVTAYRSSAVSGYVNTSHGRATTTVGYDYTFQSQVKSSAAMSINQTSQMQTTVTHSDSSGTTATQVTEKFPLSIAWTPLTSTDIDQELSRKTSVSVNGAQTFYSDLERKVTLLDGGVLIGASGPQTNSSYTYSDWKGGCYNHQLAAVAQMITTDSVSCNNYPTGF